MTSTSLGIDHIEITMWLPSGSSSSYYVFPRQYPTPYGSPSYTFNFSYTVGPQVGPYEIQFRVVDIYQNYQDFACRLDVGAPRKDLPYSTNFDSMLLGTIYPQDGWLLWQGVADVVSSAVTGAYAGPAAFSGQQCLRISNTARLRQSFNNSAYDVWIGMYVIPSCSPDISGTFTLDLSNAKVAFQNQGAQGGITVFNGNGSGGGIWTDSGSRLGSIDGSGRPPSWNKVTVRLTRDLYYLYLNGYFVGSYNTISSNAAPFASMAITGSNWTDSYVDSVSVSTVNPFSLSSPSVSVSNISLIGASFSWVPDVSSGSPIASSTVEVQKSDGTVISTIPIGGSGNSTSVSNLYPGSGYQIRVKNTNAAGESSPWSALVAFTTLADTTPPSSPSGLNASGRSDTSVTIRWTGSSDNYQVAGYDLYRDGVKINGSLISGLTYTDSGITATGNYVYTVVAKDPAGNSSPASAGLSVGFAMDIDTDSDGISDPIETRLGSNPSVANVLQVPTTSFGSVNAGLFSGFVAKGNGTLWGWGRNTDGALGDNSRTLRASPVQTLSLTNIVQVRNGYNFTLALKNDGTVWSFGDNASGQLGNGVAIRGVVASQVTGLTKIVSIAAGNNHSVALRADGTVWVWGNNATGQLGDGSTASVGAPKQVPNLGRVVAIAAGNGWTAVVRSDGGVWTWGQDNYGQLGDGAPLATRTSPAPIGLGGAAGLSAGEFHCLAWMSDGTVRAWGRNNYGQLGINSTVDQSIPVTVSGLSGIVETAAGTTHSLARRNNGAVYAWGNQTVGATGSRSNSPALISAVVNGIPSAAGISAGSEYSLVLVADGSVYQFGSSYYGTAGTGVTTAMRILPLQATNFIDVLDVAAGQSHAAVVRADGKVYCWGLNSSGQLGCGSIPESYIPVAASGLSNIRKVAAGFLHTLALDSSGAVKAWGRNYNGQLGDNSYTGRNTPVQVSGLTSGVVQIAAGNSISFAIKSDGTVWSWGMNNLGQLGLGDKVERKVPAQIPTTGGFTSIVSVKATSSFALALKSDGTVWSWGNNTNGQLGNGTTTESTVPVQIPGLYNVTSIAAGSSFALARLSDGTVRSWGLNSNGQLGDNTTVQKLSPISVPGLTGVSEVYAGGTHALAKLNDGSIRAWGSGTSGELGDGSSVQRNTPVTMVNLAGGVSSVASGQGFNIILMNDFSLRANGTGVNGQLGVIQPLPSLVAIRTAASGSDTDADGMADAWEVANLGGISGNPALDNDSDGLTNIEEFSRGSNPNVADADADCLTDIVDVFPNDYFNGAAAQIVIDSGDNQMSAASTFLPVPMKVLVKNQTTQNPIAGARVQFQVTQGGGLLATTNTGSPSLSSVLVAVTDATGRAWVYFKQPATLGVISKVSATVGGLSVTFTASNQGGPNDDDDGDGLTNSYEENVSMTNRYLPDSDGDLINDGLEVLLGTNPLSNLESNAGPIGFGSTFDLVIRTPSANYGITTSTWVIQSVP
ncbi:fibronectin type III domain-containing protein [Nibricoccus sp. IMCC34717]|uniref:RCC1 domain-containing protein n=1 Tax=Nibricoccus sp. IMCC34717 TaxID=3034021 RepID=UPI00384FABDB